MRPLADRVTRRKARGTEQEDRNEEEVTVLLKTPATIQGSQGFLKKKTLSTKEKGVKSKNEQLRWLQEYKKEKKWISSLL